ncbi:urea transporter [Kocuria sp. cx-455]|uniref:urea transporter n=1 Tax=Kocuria sp. cx-455 TaxID=2771377 RepID=UPI001CC26C93|nr:urea transporter [Kocuria sp. cx-455]
MVQALIRSQGQIFFQRATLGGLLVLLALTVASPWLTGFALLGAAVQTGVSVWLRRPSSVSAHRDAADGIHGFCGALSGCAAWLACGPSTAALIWTVLGSALCAVLIRFLERLRIFTWLPMLTGPFCAVNSALNPVFGRWHRDTSEAPPFEFFGPLPELVTGTVRASAQVLLTDHLLTGLLILALMFLAGAREGLWSLTGAMAATALGLWILGGEPATAGLAGYCGLLTALALGAVFPPDDAARALRLLVPLAGACVTVPLWWAMDQTGMAVYTWPFVLTTWVTLVTQRRWTRREVAGAAS